MKRQRLQARLPVLYVGVGLAQIEVFTAEDRELLPDESEYAKKLLQSMNVDITATLRYAYMQIPSAFSTARSHFVGIKLPGEIPLIEQLRAKVFEHKESPRYLRWHSRGYGFDVFRILPFRVDLTPTEFRCSRALQDHTPISSIPREMFDLPCEAHFRDEITRKGKCKAGNVVVTRSSWEKTVSSLMFEDMLELIEDADQHLHWIDGTSVPEYLRSLLRAISASRSAFAWILIVKATLEKPMTRELVMDIMMRVGIQFRGVPLRMVKLCISTRFSQIWERTNMSWTHEGDTLHIPMRPVYDEENKEMELHFV